MANSAHVIKKGISGGLENLPAGLTTYNVADLGLTQKQVDQLLFELSENGFDGTATLNGTNAAPSSVGTAYAARITANGGSAVVSS